jgi:phenylpyruvate tautomerase PptA (4-oxalocrotonate tautomerase family)
MPTILLTLPQGGFPGSARDTLVRRLNALAAEVEQMPGDARTQALVWVLIDEVAPGGWTCGGIDAGEHLLPCMVQVLLPAGVLDEAARQRYVQGVHQALAEARPAGDARPLASSVLLHEVADGRWGVAGRLWRLPDFARAAGYAHLQSLAGVAR